MRFTVPGGVHIRHYQDIDYEKNAICRGRVCLHHGWGALWGPGLPPEGMLKGVHSIQERRIVRPNGVDGYEVRAIRNDGTLLRFIGVFGETIKYDRARKKEAELFDRIMDTLCWRRE